MSLLWRLLRQHVNASQLAGFTLANLVGSIIILLTIQLYSDMRPLFTEGDSFMKKDYLIVSKQVSTVGNILGKNHTFSQREIDKVKSQPFVQNVGEFTSAQFEIYAALNLPESSQRISSDIFFESVPDQYVDITSDRWDFNSELGVIPIIIPRNYLNLYNFGFSQSRGLPKLSEGAISLISLDIRVRGAKETARFKGNIIGFTDRLNTILVPQSFLDWANSRYGSDVPNPPTRLIIEVDNPANEAISTFFSENNYTTEDHKLDAGKITHLLKVVLYTVLGIGLFISLLSLYILMLSIFLLLEKSSKKIENLLLIGYHPSTISKPYYLLTLSINVVILALAILTVVILRSYYMVAIETLFPRGELSTVLPTLLFGMLLTLLASLINYIVIRKRVASIGGLKN